MLNITQKCSQCRTSYLKSSFIKGDGRCISCRNNSITAAQPSEELSDYAIPDFTSPIAENLSFDTSFGSDTLDLPNTSEPFDFGGTDDGFSGGGAGGDF